MELSYPPEIQARLLELLDIDTDIIVNQRQAREATESLDALGTEADFLELVREAEALADRFDDAQREWEHLESDIDVAKARIAHDREREKQTQDHKELTELEHEISSLERRIDMLETAEIEALEFRDAVRAERDDVIGRRDSFAQNRDQQRAEIESRRERLEDRIEVLTRVRATLVADLPADLYELYERQRARYGVGASLLQRGISSASGFSLTPSQMDEIRTSDPNRVMLCPDSNAILVRTAESGL